MKRRPFWIVAGALTVIGLLVVGLVSSLVWILTLDLQGTFHNTTSLSDLDRDGDMDVILQNVRNESEFTAFAVTTLWFNDGDGTFSAHRLDEYPLESGWDTVAGDIDGDDDDDLVIFQGYRVRVYFNAGGAQGGNPGEFSGGRTIKMLPDDGQYGSVLLGDLNNDNSLDGIVVGCCSRLFTVSAGVSKPNFSWQWINASSADKGPSFEQSPLSALDGSVVRDAALADLDGDGDLDLFAAVIASSNGDPGDRVLFNDGTGVFADSGQRLGNTDSTSVALGDMDHDGDVDALIGHANGASIWINQGGAQQGQQGMFSSSLNSIAGENTRHVFLSDLDGDSDLDALVAAPKQATIWWNDGQAGFTKSNQRFRFTNRHALAIADFNADGFADIFAAEYSRNDRTWYGNGNGTFRTRP